MHAYSRKEGTKGERKEGRKEGIAQISLNSSCLFVERVCIRAYVCVYVCMYMYIYIYICVCVYIYMYMYVCMCVKE